MAKIPTSVFKGKISTNVPRPAATSVASAGAAFSGFRELGQGIAQVGQGLGQLDQRRKKASSDSYINTMQTQFDRNNAASVREDQNFFAGSSFEGYAETRQEFLTGQREFAVENAPNDLAKERVNQYFNRVQGASFIKDTAFETKSASGFYLNQDSSNRKLRGETLYEFPSLEGAAQAKAELDTNSFNSELYDPAQKLNEITKNKQVILDNLDGMLRSGGTDLAEGNDFINGRTKFNGMLSELDPRTKEKYKKRFETAIRTEQNKNIRQLQNRALDLVSQIEVNGTTPTTKRELKSTIQMFEGLKGVEGINQQGISNMLIGLKKTAVISEDRENYKNSNLTQIINDGTIIKESRGEIKTREDAEVFKARLKFIDDYTKQILSDPAKISLQENTLLKEGTQELFDYQVARNIPKPSYYSKAVEKNIVGTFKTSPNLRKELELFMSQGDVEAKRKWLNQKGTNDRFMAQLSLASDFDDILTQNILLDLDSGEVDAQFTAHPNGKGVTDSTIQLALNNENEDFREAFSGENQAAFFNVMNDAAVSRTKQLMIGGLGLSKAAEDANKELIEANYTFIELNDTKIPLSGRFKEPQNSGRIEGFIEAYSENLDDAETIEDLKIQLDANTPVNTKFKSAQDFMKTVADQDGKMQLAKDGKGFIITYEHPLTGQIQSVKTWNQNADGSRSHVDLVVPFDDIVSQGSPYSKAINKELASSSIIGAIIKENVKGAKKEFDILFRQLGPAFEGLRKALKDGE